MTQQLSRSDHALNVSDEFDVLMRKLDDIEPILRRDADANEAGGRLTPEVEAALQRTGVFGMSIPREFGGFEFSPWQFMQVIEKLSRADASTGWCVMAIAMGSASMAAFLDPEATAEMFADPERPALLAGHGTRLGTATEVDGGHLLSGSWSFASGVHHATHIYSSATVAETGEVRMFVIPKEKAVLVDNWDVMGLRATGSLDYHLDQVFVPSGYSYALMTPESRVGGALFRLGQGNLANITHIAWGLGVGARLLEEMRAIAVAKHGTPGATVDTSEFHAAYARAEATMRSARAWVKEVWADIEATLDRGERLSTHQESMSRLSLAHVTSSAREASTIVYKWAGTAALRNGDLNRFFRDMHAGAQHTTSGPVVLQNCGRELAGQAPGAAWFYLDLIEPN
jgi:alkylation response protein AidB-like acyl-CoA dehydrogenase